ncbi:IS3 family transposase [Streptacidiphilus sp. 4-A2]|nr:IS3 family transposase [Streptacidiphilus sp. 4-A2]
MAAVGDSYDNALAENLWMLIKTECVRGRVFTSRAEADLALFEYIDGFYSPRRIQKRPGYLSPLEYEEKHYADQATADQANLKPRQPALTPNRRLLPFGHGSGRVTVIWRTEPGPASPARPRDSVPRGCRPTAVPLVERVPRERPQQPRETTARPIKRPARWAPPRRNGPWMPRATRSDQRRRDRSTPADEASEDAAADSAAATDEGALGRRPRTSSEGTDNAESGAGGG